MNFLLLPNNTNQWRFRVQQIIKVAANNSSHCPLTPRPLPSQQRPSAWTFVQSFFKNLKTYLGPADENVGVFVSRFMHYHLDMRPLQGNHNMFFDIHILSATTTTAEALHFSVQELTIAECSGHVQVKFCLVFLCKPSFLWIFHAKIKFCVLFRGTLYLIPSFRSSVSATSN